MKPKILGIDLGTTYSCVACVNEYGSAEVLLNQNNERTTPSVVWFDGKDRVVVGQEAKEMGSVHPDAVCSFIKRQMGSSDYSFDVEGVRYSPEHISSLILRKLVQDAWERLGEEIRDVVVTCPAYFFIKERDATKRAGETAGLNVLQIVNEPTAAAVAYGLEPKNDSAEQVIFIYDLGGGTFDATMMKTTADGLDVVCTDGDHQLGGKDWDDRLANYFAQRFSEETGVPVDLANDTELYYDLLRQAEETKIHLSSKTSSIVKISRGGEKVRFEISRTEFEDLTKDLLEKTIDLTFACFEVAKAKGIDRLDRVILVGGSSRMPQVARQLKYQLELEPELFDPDEAVAKGAAIIGNNILLRRKVEEASSDDRSRKILIDDLSEGDKRRAVDRVAEETGLSVSVVRGALRSVRNVSSKSFGAVSTSENGFQYVANLIFRNTPLPCEETQTFATLVDNQTSVLIELMENSQDKSPTYEQDLIDFEVAPTQEEFDRLFWRLNYPLEESVKIWEGSLKIQLGLRKGAPVDITYRLDENGLLTLTAVDQASGNRLVQTIQTGESFESDDFKQATRFSRSLIVE